MNRAVLFAAPVALAALYLTFRSSNAGAAYAPQDSREDFGPIAPGGTFTPYGDLSGADGISSFESGGADDLLGAGIIEFVAAPVRALAAAWALPARGEAYGASIREAETRYGLPQSILARLIQTESNFNAAALGPVTKSGERAAGIAQFMPGTAAEMGIDPMNAAQSIDAAGKYLRSLYNTLGTWPAALAAYNWGIGNVQRKGLAAAPPETRAYVATITKGLTV